METDLSSLKNYKGNSERKLRMRMFHEICHNERVGASELCRLFEISPSRLSQNISAMLSIPYPVIKRTKQGHSVFYSVNAENLIHQIDMIQRMINALENDDSQAISDCFAFFSMVERSEKVSHMNRILSIIAFEKQIMQSQLVAKTGLSQSYVSNLILEECETGRVSKTKQGRTVLYSINVEKSIEFFNDNLSYYKSLLEENKKVQLHKGDVELTQSL
ncbi:MAG: hypothetical protein ILP16_03305 [Spirochaetales bacterium]|nr:hypothetical protein [Spirochaetales bacterium]